ncbi:GGDEF domain-containing protein [Caldichromatium japonicum]|uniref:diguanylate cyclase n=1 Tax=Caldichromatium japonicum TaxID=2699430 RepID=A0A6G7VA36_9GAMM|nr:GGDEF domain-containing protein [Caldichromatium japonicum]QIK36726.1 GGDEF domain-containing protein [Caldichromatium japonicum]
MGNDDIIDFREDLPTASNYLRMAVPLMVQRRIPPTPYNYALWYAHVQNAHPELSRKLLAAFPDEDSYDPRKSEALFLEYFVKHYLPQSTQAQELIATLVAQLAQAVSRNLQGVHNYGASLRGAIEVFEQDVDPHQIRAMVGKLLTETRDLEELNQVFASKLKAASDQVEQLKRELAESERRARIDPLTKIPNRRGFDEAIAQALTADNETTCLLLLDIDYFKKLNDTYGHPMGDRVLQIVGGVLGKLQSDRIFIARYGGEEFAVIVNDELEAAHALAEQIRCQIAALQIKRKSTHDTIGTITVSIGLTRFRPGESAETFIERADTGLYLAKQEGRNRVIIA